MHTRKITTSLLEKSTIMVFFNSWHHIIISQWYITEWTKLCIMKLIFLNWLRSKWNIYYLMIKANKTYSISTLIFSISCMIIQWSDTAMACFTRDEKLIFLNPNVNYEFWTEKNQSRWLHFHKFQAMPDSRSPHRSAFTHQGCLWAWLDWFNWSKSFL